VLGFLELQGEQEAARVAVRIGYASAGIGVRILRPRARVIV
jgi:hypothetical protein